MLDRLLGRAELKSRIEELEEENHRLERRLEAESDRRADAVSARQDAEERVNRLEDRIADLEGRIERLQGAETEHDFRGREDLRGDRLAAVLDRLRSVEAGPEGALTAMVGPDGDVPDPVADLLGDRAGLVRRAAPCLVCVDDARLVSVALDVPLAPDPFRSWDDGFRIEESWVRPTGSYALALVRSDLFALGTYEGDERRSLAEFETDVMNRHSKGGFSQARFERRRDQQVEDHLGRCREAIESAATDRLFLVGERSVLHELGDLADRTAAVDASGDPEEALAAAFREFWTARLYLL